jgi:hypothetical protein
MIRAQRIQRDEDDVRADDRHVPFGATARGAEEQESGENAALR